MFHPGRYSGAALITFECARRGYKPGDLTWCNLGHGQPEVGRLDGGPARLNVLQLSTSDESYGPVGGTEACRQAIADHYNRLYRRSHTSKYHQRNVAVCAGGRLALLRALSALPSVRLGYPVPDYMSFEALLETQAHRHTQIPVLIPHGGRDGLSVQQFTDSVRAHALSGFLMSNPSNPTGHVIEGGDLAAIVKHARNHRCSLLMDEFYSHYLYDEEGSPCTSPISAAAHIEDIQRDPVVIIDGLTKNFRYPGWRLGWIVGPEAFIEQVIRVATGLDGGCSTMVQRAAADALSPDYADLETSTTRATFAKKRRLMIDSLRRMGITVHREPRGSFYVWGDLSALPRPFDDAYAFFEAALELKVITVPGIVFDINPGGHRRSDTTLRRYMRFSFGPEASQLVHGLERLERMVLGANSARRAN